MRVFLAVTALVAASAVPAVAGDQAGTTVTWECGSEITGKTGTKQYG